MWQSRKWSAPLLGMALLAGCGPGEVAEEDGATVSEAPVDDGIKTRTSEQLPRVGDYLTALDDGKIDVAGPENWNRLSRSSKFLAGFAKGKPNDLPSITVVAADPPIADVSDLSVENCDAIAAQLTKQMRTEKKTLFETVKPIRLGDTLYLRHVRKVSYAGTPAVIQSLQTIVGGRLYTVELIAEIEAARSEEYEASLKKYRDYGYAVAANLRFLGGTSEVPVETVNP